MTSLKQKESFLHAIVEEFLESVGYTNTLDAYHDELEKYSITLEKESLPNQLNEENLQIQESFLKLFNDGDYKAFWFLWKQHINESLQTENETQRLEFKIQLYFAVYPLRKDENRLSPVEASMQDFKHYLETNGATLSQTTEFVAFYALPFVPNPKNHPTFKDLFEEKWQADVKSSLEIFLYNLLYSVPLPYLYKLHESGLQKSNQEADEMNNLKQKMKEHEYRASNYFQKFAKLQGDYHNLIGIAAELVDSLEKCVRGQMITPDYLQDICHRLFGETVDKSIDFTRPGTAGDLLRASISNEDFMNGAAGQQESYPALNFKKIKEDLEDDMPPRKKTLLLQALIWRMTKSLAGKQRDAIISSYITNDIFGCQSDGIISDFIEKIYSSHDDLATEYLSRFINSIASFTAGRLYLAQSRKLIKTLVRVIMKSKNSAISENVLGGLQKLSLRRHVQNILIDCAVIEWLFKTLEEPDHLSDYALEYTVALLMNLCLRTAGKKKCCLHPEKMLKLLLDLLNHDNQEIRPYVNGTLYSILSLPSIRTAANHMGIEDILLAHMHDETQDQHQLKFIVKQLDTVDDRSDDEIVSDGDDDDDGDDEGDAIDAESEKDETVIPTIGELYGEKLLCKDYISIKSVSSTNKKIKASLDEPFTRPVTPARKPTKSQSSIDVPSRLVTVNTSLERPRTSSSKGNRRPPPEQARPRNEEFNMQAKTKHGKKFKQAFTSRPKIPRTPDSGSEKGSRPNSSTEVPPLTRSVSPTRPNSGKGPKISPR